MYNSSLVSESTFHLSISIFELGSQLANILPCTVLKSFCEKYKKDWPPWGNANVERNKFMKNLEIPPKHHMMKHNANVNFCL